MNRERLTSLLEAVGGGVFVAGGFSVSVGLGLMIVGAVAVALSWRMSR